MKIINEKIYIREIIKNKLMELSINNSIKNEMDEKLVEKLLDSEEYKNAHNIFCYVGMSSEVDTSRFIRRALSDNKNIAVPKITGKAIMEAVTINSLDELKSVPPYGILEPTELKDIMEVIDLIIVPGVAFDKDGGRLGHGAGFYDRFLKLHKEATTLALCYDLQLIASVPKEEHDVNIQKIISI